MRKLYRSVLWSGLIAAGVAACGDDVTVNQPTPTVHSVSVGPTGVSLGVGQTLQMIASVNADAGIATTVVWSINAPATVATISATGLLTAVGAGNVAVQACSTVNSSVCGNATVTVSAGAPVTISIKSITNTLVGTGEVPVVLTNVAGQINVTLNLDAGGQSVSNVEVLVDGAVACSQGFGAIQAAAAKAALRASDDPNAALAVEIICSINTAAFDPTTGVAKYLNGARLLIARVNLVGGTQKATPSTSLIFNNVSIIAITTTVTGGSSANNATTGILWQTGTLSATALPVIYTAGSPVINQIVLTPSAGGMLAKILTTAPFTATWAKGTTVANGGSGSGTTGVTAAGLTVNANSTVGGATGPVGFSNALNLDNQAPGTPTFIANPNGRRNGWINATVALTGGSAAVSGTSNNWLLNGAADAGVGGYNRFLRIGAGGVAATVAAAIAATASATPALPAPSATNNTNCAVASATDALGNESTLPASGASCLQILTTDPSAFSTGSNSVLFGVDIDAPTIAFDATSLAANARLTAATIGTQFVLTVADAGITGVSGMLAGSPVIGNVSRFSATGTSCFFGGTSCANISINGAPALPLVPTTTVAASTLDGYYTGTFIALDAAGNSSAAVTRSIVYELNTPNPATLTNALFNVPLTGSTVTFTALASDNLDIRDVQYALTYAGGLTFPILYPVTPINTFPPVPGTLQNSNVSAGTTIAGFMRQVEDVTGQAPITVGGQFKPSAITGTIRDQVQTSAPVPTGILAGQVTTGVSYLTATAPLRARSWAVTNPAATLVSDGNTTTPANATSVTLVADAFGPTATFNAPFTRVDFYIDNGTNLVQIGTGVPAGIFDDGSAFGRRHRWTFAWTPGTIVAPGALNIYAIGVNANGDALVSPVNSNITLTNP